MLHTLVMVIHVLASIGLIVLVLLQQGKGADAGAAFGSGASATVFGSQGSASFLTRTTAVLATVFFITSLTLAYMAGHGAKQSSSVLDIAPKTSTQQGAPDQSKSGQQPAQSQPAAPEQKSAAPADSKSPAKQQVPAESSSGSSNKSSAPHSDVPVVQ
ncbi:MAG TPA: preprotein translocase subunit SecG [Gammaproteobacteria bacterium]|nr:preprotein translocase subunit SecG [Gammaproteobacteria bacterium]